jgi:hypothetical protein
MKAIYPIPVTVLFCCLLTVSAFAADDKPNILVIMGDDIAVHPLAFLVKDRVQLEPSLDHGLGECNVGHRLRLARL